MRTPSSSGPLLLSSDLANIVMQGMTWENNNDEIYSCVESITTCLRQAGTRVTQLLRYFMENLLQISLENEPRLKKISPSEQ